MLFNEIIGQDRAIGRLKTIVTSGHIAGAYLFAGPEGIGKRLCAVTFAKAINCIRQDGDGCGACDSCLSIGLGRSADVHLIDKEADGGDGAAVLRENVQARSEEQKIKPKGRSEEITIEDIRLLQQEIVFRPSEARVKVFIINNAHMLNAESSNAFLKTLEEPPKSSLIILVTDKPRLLYKTILSRCQVIRFGPLSRRECEDFLLKKGVFDERNLRYLSYSCEGRIGNALARKGDDVIASKNRVLDFFFREPEPSIEHAYIQDRRQLRESLCILAAWVRDIYVAQAGMRGEDLINRDRQDAVGELARQYPAPQLDMIMRTISDALLGIEQNGNAKLLLANVLFAIRTSS